MRPPLFGALRDVIVSEIASQRFGLIHRSKHRVFLSAELNVATEILQIKNKSSPLFSDRALIALTRRAQIHEFTR